MESWSGRSTSVGCGAVRKEIIEDILVKLPVKSIVRFKSVSKSWFNLIKSNEFMHKLSQEDSCFHLAISFVVYTGSFRHSSSSPPSFLDVCIYPDYKWLTFPLLPGSGPGLTLVGNCNGILCFNNCYGDLALVNPLLSEVKLLPPRTIPGFELVGFGFDNNRSSMDFKVVKIVQFQTREEEECPTTTMQGRRLSSSSHQVVQVFNLRSNAWRELEETGLPLLRYTLENICSTFLDGKVYWCVSFEEKFNCQRILCFDLATELFQLIEFPQDYPSFTSRPRLIVINQDSLALVSYPQDRWSNDLVHMWTMNNDEHTNENEQVTTTTTWTKLCSVVSPPHLLTPISFSKKHNKFLYETTTYDLIIYDVINQSSSSIFDESRYRQYINKAYKKASSRKRTWLQVREWRPSLISLN